MTYIKLNAVDDAQTFSDATAYANEIGLIDAVVMTDTGKVFSTQAQLSQGEVYFESDSFGGCKLGKVVAWGVSDKPTLVSEPVNPIQQILDWFKAAKPNPTSDDQCVQIGCHFEEIKEMSEALGIYSEEVGIHAERFKTNFEPYKKQLEALNEVQRIELLDACGDQIITAVGVAYMLGMDIDGALSEIIRSNNSKFVDGKPVLNEHGKIVKPDTYSPPKLEPFLGDKA